MVRVNLAGQTAHPGTLSLGMSVEKTLNPTMVLIMAAKVLSPTWSWDGAMVGMTYLMIALVNTFVNIKVTKIYESSI